MMIDISVSITSMRRVATVVARGAGRFETWPSTNGDLPLGGLDGKGSGKKEHWPKNKELPPVLTVD